MDADKNIKYINNRFKNIVDKNIKSFEQSIIKNYNFEKTYKLKNPILCKHFIVNAIEEFNNILTLENKDFRVNFWWYTWLFHWIRSQLFKKMRMHFWWWKNLFKWII